MNEAGIWAAAAIISFGLALYFFTLWREEGRSMNALLTVINGLNAALALGLLFL